MSGAGITARLVQPKTSVFPSTSQRINQWSKSFCTFGHRKASKILVPQNAGWPPQFVWWKSSCNDSESSYKTRIPARIMNRRILSCKSCCAPMGFWHGSSRNLSLNMPHCSLFLRYLHRISHHLLWCLGAHSSSILSPRNWLTAQQHTCLSCKGQEHPSHMFIVWKLSFKTFTASHTQHVPTFEPYIYIYH